MTSNHLSVDALIESLNRQHVNLCGLQKSGAGTASLDDILDVVEKLTYLTHLVKKLGARVSESKEQP